MNYKIFLYTFILLGFNSIQGQLLQKKNPFSRADSLRGYLGPLRSGFDIHFYDLSVKVDPKNRFIEGENKIYFTALRDLRTIQMDLFHNMSIKEILWNGKSLNFTRELNAIFIAFPVVLKRNSLQMLQISYSGNPQVAKNPPWDGGFTWSKDTAGKPWIGVSCQGIGASLWWPNKDHQSDEPDSMMIRVSVPNGLKDISNGRLAGTVDLGNGYTRFDWRVLSPINNYDVTLNIGTFIQFSENFQDLSCDYYVLPEHESLARQHFQQVKTMLNTFTYYFGPYPFKADGYKLIETPYLGMEHQSAISYGNKYKNGYLGSDLSGTGYGMFWDYIIVHESAHEWFGNNITTKDIADMWVHESFANYAEGLYVEFNQGYAPGQDYIFGLRSQIQNDSPIIGVYNVNKEGSGDMYAKGAVLLNMVRHLIQKDSLWFAILKKMNAEFYHKTITGSDMINFICTQSRLDLHPVFDQYLKTNQIPNLEIELQDSNQLHYKWNNCNLNFTMPIDIIVSAGKSIRIYPKASIWQKTTLPSGIAYPDIKPDTHSFYIQVNHH